MQRITAKPVELADGRIRYRVHVEQDPSPEAGAAGEFAKLDLLRTIAGTHGMAACGPKTFDWMAVTYNGTAWVADLEAVVDA